MSKRTTFGLVGALAAFIMAGCAPLTVPSASSAPYDPAKPQNTASPSRPPSPIANGRRVSVQESIAQNQRFQAEEQARKRAEQNAAGQAANAPSLPGRVEGRASLSTQGSQPQGPGGAIYNVQAFQQSVTWACFARFRPDADQLLLRLLGQRPSYLIELQPDNFRRTVLALGDPSRRQMLYERPAGPAPRNEWEQKLQRDSTRSEVDELSAWTAKYVATLMSMPNAGARDYQHAREVLGRSLARMQGKYPDDRLLCMQAVLAEQFGGVSAANTEKALLDILQYGTNHGGLSSTCFIGAELARRELQRSNVSGALQRLEGLHTPGIGVQAGQPRTEDAYRDFGCQGAKWLQGGIYWSGIGGQRNAQQALGAYRFCSRSLDQCRLNVLLMAADDVKTPDQRHLYVQQILSLQQSRDRDVAARAAQMLSTVSSAERTLAAFPLGVVRAFEGMVTVTLALKAACVEAYGLAACERSTGYVAPQGPKNGNVMMGFVEVDPVEHMREGFKFIEDLNKN